MWLKWCFDRTIAFLGLLLLFPLLLSIALFIRIKMPGGSIFFIQQRVGYRGKLFRMVKFRSMVAQHNGSTVTVAGETRITPFGRFLRRYKLDELPELWNVLCGKMSFVGPRPDVPGFADQLQGEERLILELRPGITGPASIKYRNEEELLAQVADPERYNREVLFPDKVQINLAYYREWSFWKDMYYIFVTLFR